jgi:DNA-binding transcriptional LysR family regulator
MDRLDAMQVLLAVVDGGSLSAGGRKLNVSLPSVSRRLAELEDRLGTRLLIRTTRNVQLTDAGRDYVEAVRPIVAQLEEADRRASGEYDRPRGQLTVTLPGGSSRSLAVPLILEFLEQHPEITINMISDERTIDLIDGRVDVGVRLGPLSDSSLFAVKVGDVLVSTVASPEYLARKGEPRHPEELAEHDGILFDPLVPAAWVYSVEGQPVEGRPRCRVRANRTSVCIEAALRGFGLTRVARTAAEGELRSGGLVAVLEEHECQLLPVHLVYVKQGLLPLKVRAFLDWMAPGLRKKVNELNSIGRRR